MPPLCLLSLAWAAQPTLWEPCFSLGTLLPAAEGKKEGSQGAIPPPDKAQHRPEQTQSPYSLAPGNRGGARGGALPCPERRCWSPARRPCMWQSANTWSETGAKPSRWSRPSTRRAATAAPSSTASATAKCNSLHPQAHPEGEEGSFSPAPFASPRNSPPWWSRSTVLNSSHPPRRRGSRYRAVSLYIHRLFGLKPGTPSLSWDGPRRAQRQTSSINLILSGLNLAARRTTSCLLPGAC